MTLFWNILSLLGGLSLFLFGMSLMGEGLERRAGKRLKGLLGRLTSNRFYGLLLGIGVTALIQSSSAVTVMAVGFVNSGLMTLGQSIGIIMGANIGTTVTSWLLSLWQIEGGSFLFQLLKPSSFTPVLALIGVVLYLFLKREEHRYTGLILLGFSVLMFGMDAMSGAMKPLSELPAFQRIFLLFSNPLLGVLTGAVMTAILQSSSASVGILQALSLTGVLRIEAAIPLIMGQNIGTCVTSLLASVGAGIHAKRTAMVHLYFNLIGTVALLIPFFLLRGLGNAAFLQGEAGAVEIALIHTFFNVISTLILFPLAGFLERLAILSVRDRKGSEREEVVLLDPRLLTSAALAVSRSRSVSEEMACLALDNVRQSFSLFWKYDETIFLQIEKTEGRIDRLEDELGSYLVAIGDRNIAEVENREINVLLHLIGEFERISDHALNLAQVARARFLEESDLPQVQNEEVEILFSAVGEIAELATEAFCQNDSTLAARVEPLEEVIDSLRMQIHALYVERLQKGECRKTSGLAIADLLINLERIADHCSNIAARLLTAANHQPPHAYLQYVRTSGQETFSEWYGYYQKRYQI